MSRNAMTPNNAASVSNVPKWALKCVLQPLLDNILDGNNEKHYLKAYWLLNIALNSVISMVWCLNSLNNSWVSFYLNTQQFNRL